MSSQTFRPTVEIPLFKVFMPPPEALLPRLEGVLYSGHIAEGDAVVAFEAEFARHFECSDVLSFNSGTAALHTALTLCGVKQGDEVISTPMTAEPTNLAILHAGGSIVWGDVNPANGNLDPAGVARRITPRTRAIIAVHYGGIPVDLDGLHAVAKAHGIPVIEDAAHALGAKYHGRTLGSHSPYVMFSLQAIKHLTTVDGGMLSVNVTAREAVLSAGRRLRWFGIDRNTPRTEVDVKSVGYKYHMNNVAATIGLVQLDHVDAVLARHVANGRYLDAALTGIDGLALCQWQPHAQPSYWVYTVLVERRAAFEQHLKAHGIGCTRAHRRNDLHSVFAASRTKLPGLDHFYAHMTHLPCGWWVDDAQREYIVDVIREGW